MSDDDENEGAVRRLTSGEVDLCKTIYGDYIDYYKVWVHDESYFPFNLQSEKYAMSPNGELYFRGEYYSDDFSFSGSSFDNHINAIHTFIHEMCHVWQHQQGMLVRLRGLFSFMADYRYQLLGDLLSSYSIEQQAAIVADYYVLKSHGLHSWSELINNNYVLRYDNFKYEEILSLYEVTLAHFPAGE